MLTFTFIVGFFAGVLALVLYIRTVDAARDRRTLDEQRFDTLVRTSNLLGELFGPNARLAFIKVRGKPEEIHVACRHCGQRNRLFKRIEGAICGACKKQLCLQRNEKVEARESTMNVN